MPYVQRNAQGNIICLFANAQPQPDGSSLTEPKPLADDDPEVISFLQSQVPAKVPSTEELAAKIDQIITTLNMTTAATVTAA